MPLNPAATAFTPKQPPPSPTTTTSNTDPQNSQPPTTSSTTHATTKDLSTRKQKYQQYLDKRKAIIHTIIRCGYECAKLDASSDDRLHDANVKDKLIVHMVRMLAGLGWSTSTVLRAAVLLEVDPGLDALQCLRDAWGMGREVNRKEETDEGVVGDGDGDEAADGSGDVSSVSIEVGPDE